MGKELIRLLRDSFWKVRTTACVSLGNTGQTVQEETSLVLKKMLVEGQSNINKHIICETIVRLGQKGEALLLQLATMNCHLSNVQLRAAVLQAFHLVDLSSPHLDSIFQLIFQNIQYLLLIIP